MELIKTTTEVQALNLEGVLDYKFELFQMLLNGHIAIEEHGKLETELKQRYLELTK